MNRPTAALLALLILPAAVPAAAQSRAGASTPPPVAIRPFLLVTGEQFAARRTFEAVFDSAFQPMWGGGVSLVLSGDYFVDLSAERFSKTGQRAFLTATTAYKLGIPLSVTMTPFEISGGYRFRRLSRRVIPYVGVGFGSYAYRESSPQPYSVDSENVDTRHAGFLAVGGAELRLHRWVGLAVDARFTRVSGILGQAGLSKAAGENDLGGTAVRARVLIGR